MNAAGGGRSVGRSSEAYREVRMGAVGGGGVWEMGVVGRRGGVEVRAGGRKGNMVGWRSVGVKSMQLQVLAYRVSITCSFLLLSKEKFFELISRNPFFTFLLAYSI